jgi:hypothetical protein
MYANTFAEFLLPEGHFGLTILAASISLSIQPIVNMTHSLPSLSTQTTHLPKLVCSLTSQANCWNQMSREECEDVLESKPRFHALIHYFNLMYSSPNHCYFRKPDETLDHFLQEDGFPQGGPLSPALACLVIHRFLKPINQQLAQRAASCRSNQFLGDDGCGSKSAFQAYFNDANFFLPYQDLPFVLTAIATHGPSKGIFINRTKTKILTLPADLSTQQTLLPDQFTHLQEALALLDGTNSEIKGGFQLLGQPIGSDAFATSFLQTAADTFATSISSLSKQITDPQSMATLFKSVRSLPCLTSSGRTSFFKLLL